MKIDYQVMEALELLERERGVPVDTILDALANALVSAYKRTSGTAEEARVTIDPESGDIKVYAQILDEEGAVVREWEDESRDFGRIAAQTAKQVIAQRLRIAKREQIYAAYAGREGDLVTGIVQQVDGRYIIFDLGNAEALMPASERIPHQLLDRGNRAKALILEVKNEPKGPQIILSRSHPDLVRRLLELEVPELVEGVVEIVAIAREPGHRTKIAVVSPRSKRRSARGLRGSEGLAGAAGGQGVAQRKGGRRPIPGRCDFLYRGRSGAGPHSRSQDQRGGEKRGGDRLRTPAFPGDRQGRSKRSPCRPPYRIPDRHPL